MKNHATEVIVPRRQPQILVIGSAFDTLAPDPHQLNVAETIGRQIAQADAILMFGAEPDVDSYPTVAARAARASGGITVAFPPGSSKQLFDPTAATIICPLSVDRGGPREALLSRMGDAVILIRGGSGGATEALAAYQGLIPLVCLAGSGGWADRLLDQPIDERAVKRVVLKATSAEQAVALAWQQACRLIGTAKVKLEPTRFHPDPNIR